MGGAPEYLAEIIAEVARRHHLRRDVARAGYVRDDGDEWVPRAKVAAAVGALRGIHHASVSLRREVRQFLLLEGWVERKREGEWFWRARAAKAGKVKKRG